MIINADEWTYHTQSGPLYRVRKPGTPAATARARKRARKFTGIPTTLSFFYKDELPRLRIEFGGKGKVIRQTVCAPVTGKTQVANVQLEFHM